MRTKERSDRARRAKRRIDLDSLLRPPHMQEPRERLRLLAIAADRSMIETLRILLLQVEISPEPEIRLNDLLSIVYLRRTDPPGLGPESGLAAGDSGTC